MSKSAKKGKKEDEAKLAEERTAFEERLAVDRASACLAESSFQSAWLGFLTPDNVRQLAAQAPGSSLTVSLLLFVRLYEAKLTPKITQNEFKLASFLADSVFGYCQTLQLGAEQTAFAIDFFLNGVLRFSPADWSVQVREQDARWSPEVAFEDWKDGKFTFTKNKMEEGFYRLLLGEDEEAEGVWAVSGPASIDSSGWNNPGLKKLYWEAAEQFEKHTNKKMGHDFSEDIGRLFSDATHLFGFFLAEQMEEQLTEEIKAVERPKQLAEEIHDDEPLRPLQAIDALQNSKVVATPRGPPKGLLVAPPTDAGEALGTEDLDPEALQFIRDEVARVRERLQSELDAKVAEAATAKKGKK